MEAESWVEQPPSIDNPAEAKEAHEVLRREKNVPRGHVEGKDLRPSHTEEVSPPPKALNPDLVWFFPGLAYCMIGLDRSMFDMYASNINDEVNVTTYRANKPIVLFDGADISANSWFYTIQGIAPTIGQSFIDFIETFQFRDALKSLEWAISVKTVRVADPFVTGKVEGVWLQLALPRCLTSNRHVTVTGEPGLQLNDLRLGVSMAGE